MSVDYYMVCHECKKSIWVGHHGFSGWSFYSAEPDCMKALGKFLESCSFHGQMIALVPEHDDAAEEYEEVQWKQVG